MLVYQRAICLNIHYRKIILSQDMLIIRLGDTPCYHVQKDPLGKTVCTDIVSLIMGYPGIPKFDS
jgi:hypothetical protein